MGGSGYGGNEDDVSSTLGGYSVMVESEQDRYTPRGARDRAEDKQRTRIVKRKWQVQLISYEVAWTH